MQAWVKAQGEPSGDFEQLLQKTYPSDYQERIKGKENEPFRVLESYDTGVSLTRFSWSTHTDSLASLRPKISRVVKEKAILTAFHFLGRPYEFGFETDSALVCSELVAKSYESSSELNGLTFPSASVMGRAVIAPNLLAQSFDESFGQKNAQFDFVLFYDANEYEQESQKASIDEFRESWKRPKWHILLNN